MNDNWHSSLEPTRAEIARSYFLWGQYVDADATMTEAEFDALTIDERMAIMVECFGDNEEAD